MDSERGLILYVDDERSNRVVFEASFGRTYRVECVDSGARALEILRNKKTPVAVLITDQRMPGMSGEELLRQALLVSPDTVRIVITAYSDLDPILRAVNEGLVVRYVIKPWERAELERILRWALEMYDLGRTNSAVRLRLIENERLLTLGLVAAAVLHEIRQPISIMSSNIGTLEHLSTVAPTLQKLVDAATHDSRFEPEELRLLDLLAKELPTIATEAQASLDLVLEVITNLSLFVKRQDGPRTKPRNCDPVPLIGVTIALCRHEAYRLGASIDNETPARLASVYVTQAHLMQVLINLIRNGLQACARAGEGHHVVVHAIEEHDAVRFTVRDDGEGMSAEVLAKIGTPFFTTHPDGTGLGIGQSRRLVGLANGDFDIQSKRGQGTVATFTLPRSRP